MLIKDTNLLFLTFCKLIVLVHNQIAVKKESKGFKELLKYF